MVFFTCNSCGESLKKAQIEKHVGMCRGSSCFSCIDCGKDFWGEEYKNHLRCISEDQKYGGRGYEAKANKGDVKQQQWIQRIQEALSKPGVSVRLKDLLNQICSYDNVPRKKAKFQNWIKCSLKIHDLNLQNQVWEIISAAESSVQYGEVLVVKCGNVCVQKPNGTQRPEPKPDPPLPQQQQLQTEEEEEKPREKKKNKRERKEERQKKNKNKKNGENTTDEQKIKKKKKRKRDAEEEEEGQDEEEEPTVKPKKKKGEEPGKGKFNWKGTIKAVLREGPDEGLSVKKLRKKVLAAYYSFSGEGNYRSEEELYSVFNRKLNGPKFKVLKDKVKLVK
uniref:Cell growth-regulating nucleolar protein n=1 Tax=Astyanax mexicanus TaxID=7994 RepID=A0A3B1IRF5_ASTMX